MTTKSATDIYLEKIISEIDPKARGMIAHFSYQWQGLYWGDAFLRVEFKEGVLNDYYGKPCSKMSFDLYDLADKEHVKAIRMEHFIGSHEYQEAQLEKERLKEKLATEWRWNEALCPVYKTAQGTLYLHGKDLYNLLSPLDHFSDFFEEELKPFEKGKDYLAIDLWDYILPVPTAIKIIQNAQDCSVPVETVEEFEQRLENWFEIKKEN